MQPNGRVKLTTVSSRDLRKIIEWYQTVNKCVIHHLTYHSVRERTTYLFVVHDY